MKFQHVRPEKEKALERKMESLGLYEKDIQEKFITAGGKGGQHVNRSSTCVYLRHLPTGLEVKEQRERSQGLNRFLARRVLVEKYEAGILGIKSAKIKEGEKRRKQKKRRKRRSRSRQQQQDLPPHSPIL